MKTFMTTKGDCNSPLLSKKTDIPLMRGHGYLRAIFSKGIKVTSQVHSFYKKQNFLLRYSSSDFILLELYYLIRLYFPLNSSTTNCGGAPLRVVSVLQVCGH